METTSLLRLCPEELAKQYHSVVDAVINHSRLNATPDFTDSTKRIRFLNAGREFSPLFSRAQKVAAFVGRTKMKTRDTPTTHGRRKGTLRRKPASS